MGKFQVFHFSCLVGSLLVIRCNTMNEKEIISSAPVAEKRPHQLTEHGNVRTDDYFWLNNREDKDVINYLKKENDYTQAYFDKHKSLLDNVYKEMKSRVLKDDESVPYLYNGFHYHVKYEGDNEYAFYYRRPDQEGSQSELILDVNALAKDKPFCDEAQVEVSPDNKVLAYSIDFVGRRRYEIYFKDIATGKLLPDVIKNTTGSIAWCNDNKTVFYTIEDDQTLRAYKIMRHVLGTDVSQDICVYEEKDETFYVDVDRSKSGNYIFIHAISTTTSECLFLNSNQPNKEFTVLEKRVRGHEYTVEEANGKFYIRTNLDAKNFRICSAPVNAFQKENWKNVYAYDAQVLTEGFELFRDFMVVESRIDGLVKLKVFKFDDQSSYFINAPEEDYIMGIGINHEFNAKSLRYYYGSLKTPACEFEYNLVSKEQKLLKQQKLSVPYDANLYETKRIYATSHDGKKIPISLVYRKDKFSMGHNPCLIYGYGSYGVIIDPYFSGSRLSLLDRGFVFAIAHIRGGENLGREWYEDGKLLNKKNTFLDFIACSEYLKKEQFAHTDKLFAQGGSAGGLLMGAIVNMRPDLYRGVVADVPFVDVITTMTDTSIPLTTGEYDEWGNPNEKKYYDYMLSYSPYDNVAKHAYPAMLVTTGLHDSQVQYWEPAKWVAKLRAMKTDNHILLLHTNMDAGHGGASGRFEGLKEVARSYTFMLTNL